ncbi:uncharacterized protein [Antedon mediterranea]|uniref:uncharacterized protein n=1 Tax=Antedon mediterranea TaxID=105859 RepID=UPI003AF9BD10
MMYVLLLVCVTMQHFEIKAEGADGSQKTLHKSIRYSEDCEIPGIPGLPGHHGPVGIDGNMGIDGYMGQKGYYGNAGDIGLYGPDGQMGPIGLSGQPGVEGIEGHNGADGYIGNPGNIGDPGLPGYKGSSGKVGNSGLKGEPGAGEVPQDNIVAFTVARATEMSASKEISIDFTHILSDLNGDFDMVNDSYTCRIQGVYLFSFSFASDSTTSPSVNIIRNSTNILSTHSTSVFSVIQTSTNIMVLNLLKGDTIWLRMNAGSSIHCRGKMLCSFTGVLLHAT